MRFDRIERERQDHSDGSSRVAFQNEHDNLALARCQRGAAFYEDRYVRTPEGWRIKHTGYRRTFEMSYDLSDLPGLKITGPGVHTHVDV